MKRVTVWLPLAVFTVLAGFFFKGLSLDPGDQPSALIGHSFPTFNLTDLHTRHKLTKENLPNQPFLMNVWATWCITCQVEHPYLTELSKTIPVVGLNYKDKASAAVAWLEKLGDPYMIQIFDPDGRLGIDLGVAGAPETFLVDANGIIHFRVQGEVNERVFLGEIQPLLETLQ